MKNNPQRSPDKVNEFLASPDNPITKDAEVVLRRIMEIGKDAIKDSDAELFKACVQVNLLLGKKTFGNQDAGVNGGLHRSILHMFGNCAQPSANACRRSHKELHRTQLKNHKKQPCTNRGDKTFAFG